MIRIRVQEAGDQIIGLHFSGHAYSNDPGKDLVCAAISSIAIGVLNALEETCPGQDLLMNDNEIIIRIIQPTLVTNTILKVAYIQCDTVYQQNRKFIMIKKEKVK